MILILMVAALIFCVVAVFRMISHAGKIYELFTGMPSIKGNIEYDTFVLPRSILGGLIPSISRMDHVDL